MRLLLDVHHSPRAARRLREQGCDVVAAAEDPVLATLEDEELLRAAARDGRTLVTENARDFDRIVRGWAALGEHHAGVVFTSPRRYHRGSQAYPENLIAALAALLHEPPDTTVDWVHWLADLSPRELGFDRDATRIPEDFDASLPDEVEDEFEQ